MAYRQGAGFIKHHHVDFFGFLQHFGIPDQNTIPGSGAGPGHDGSRRCQTQCTRTGNDQHRYGMNQGRFTLTGKHIPARNG